TSARPSGARPEVPAKMTSSILPPRRSLAPCVPITQRSASSTFDLPEPFGPTTQVIPGSKRKVVAEAKDLKPFSVKLFRCTWLMTPLSVQSYAEHSRTTRETLPAEKVYPAARHGRGTHAPRRRATCPRRVYDVARTALCAH